MTGRLTNAMLAVLLALCCAGTGAMRASSQARDQDMSLKERPVMKVVRLLKDMQAELQRDLDDDKAVHEKLSCWCAENDKEKTQAIDMGKQKSDQLKSSMDEATAKILELKTKRKATMDELYSDQKALDTATAIRMEAGKDFHGTETSLLDAINAAKQAIVVLGQHHPELAQLRSAAKQLEVARATELVTSAGGSRLRTSQLAALKDFVQQANQASSLVEIPGYQSYRPQSGQIFGILKQMVADFEEDLSAAQKAEAKAQADYASLKEAKEAQIAAAQRAVAQMDADIADNGEKHAQALQEYEDTQAQLALDEQFLANLKKKCSESSEEFDARVKSRLEEIAAVQDTIKILNTDEAFDNFDKTVNTAFVQTASSRKSYRSLRKEASTLLQEVATQNAAPKLALLAQSVKLDSFEKVIAAIDKMVVELNKQQADEIKHRDWCRDELASNERSTAADNDKKAGLETKIADLGKTISTLGEEIEATKTSIAELQEQMKRASEVREAENVENQQTIMDQRITQTILAKALERMQKVYALLQGGEEPAPGAPHIATSGNHTDPGVGPARFTKYGQNAGGSRVVRMLKVIIADSQKSENDAIEAEEDAQTAYESFMKDSNKEVIASSQKLNNLQGARGKAKESLSMATTDLKETVADLEGLQGVLNDLHKSCDFILDNFDARQGARSAEVEALKEAKAILSGKH